MFDFFHYEFLQRAFAAGIITAIIAPTVGSFLVFRRYSYMADTLGHVSLLGVALGIITGISPIVGAVLVSIVAAWGIDTLRQKEKIYGESVLSLFLSGSLALALVLMSFSREFARNITSFLFGSITTVTRMDLWVMAILAIVILSVTALFYRKFFLITLDEELAEAEGVKVRLYNFILILLCALTVAISMRVVGVLLIGALMVIPVITALQFQFGFFKSILASIIFSLLSAIIGLFLSYTLDAPSGGVIVLVALFFFLLALFSKKRG